MQVCLVFVNRICIEHRPNLHKRYNMRIHLQYVTLKGIMTRKLSLSYLKEHSK